MPQRKTSKTNEPKVELHGRGVGGISQADIERRAKELAEIDNRISITPADRERARAEMLEHHLPDAQNEDADSSQSMSRDPSDPPSDRGHRVPNRMEAAEGRALQRLVLDGVEEAQHDQMTAARAEEEPFRSQPKRHRKRPPQ